jgi:ABC-2 type transport system permease protein
MSDVTPAVHTSPAGATPRPFYWSVRREIWESRSLYVAPLIVTAIVVFATLISLTALPERMQSLPADPVKRHAVIVTPYSISVAVIMLSAFFVGLFYSLEALYGERRDRSILFWKSMPVSDRTTVLSKAAIPIVVLPALALLLSVGAFFFLFFFSTLILAGNGVSPATLWSELRIVQQPIIMAYGLAAHALWFAPVYAWLLLVSAWARRMPFLWAVFPPAAIGILEKIACNTTSFASLLRGRVHATNAFVGQPGEEMPILDRVTQMTPLKFLMTPGLWAGLIVASLFLALAVRLRRRREPI